MAFNGKELTELGVNSAGTAIGLVGGEVLGSYLEKTLGGEDVNRQAIVKILGKIGLGFGLHGLSVMPGAPRGLEQWADTAAAGSISGIALDIASLVLKVPAGNQLIVTENKPLPSSAIELAIIGKYAEGGV